ncbi:phospholipid-transporting ATPase ABCA3-like isoform X2 [Ostrea edulis]|uniref:phospholipid-transporting ATPase ABCA3-like isoform X2 n=1 Tax=Ostrea edulis TaxID=37623 RepID=UPI0024AFC489|nr:phospholipid-transporting ATPase ABCA3-like isoform X2 [Ostrea edulis]XP_056001433.1 phospholipid-transporting ATPase ABCA3-like isoform X2 [Ostrea edulis]XP_056001434.1 phospholipid-transporting ATPase ABCA3-like isoform X2 [Ostrea edulis]XP_056001435.1 phospholipid-transporting ATPase ABCA3-like isoform X2 [Ostrea edulis]
MVAGLLTQFLLLTWKNILLQRRKICVTVFEIVLPLAFPILLIVIRNLADFKPTYHPATNYTKSTFYNGYNFPRKILYAPNRTLINSIMNSTKYIVKGMEENGYWSRPDIELKGFASEDHLINYLRRSYSDEYYGYSYDSAGIVFDPSHSYDSGLPEDVTYWIRMGGEWKTEDTYADKSFNPGPSYGDSKYNNMGFLSLQYAVDFAVIRHYNSSAVLPDIRVKRMPYPPYTEYGLATFIRVSISTTTVLGLILCALQLTKEIVYDREKKLKETLRMMGMSSFVYWFSWFFKGFIYLAVTFAIVVLIFQAGSNKLFEFSDSTLLFVFYLSYAVSVVAYCFLFSSFFNKASTASYFCGFIFFVTIIPNFAIDSKFEDMTRTQKMAICLINNMAMAFGFTSASEYEKRGIGVKWSSFTKPPTVDGTFSFGDAILMLWVDSAIYFLITWYIDGVRPGEFGVPQPFYFPFTKTYWCGGKQISKATDQEVKHNPKYFEDEPSGLDIGISMSHLRKVFKSGMKETVAVADTSLNIFQGQITALLGHNGAGKTTTMSMLTGFIPSTSGSARVNGYDIDDDIRSVRGSLGMCPQHDILFDNLTVKEQLEFYYKLKTSDARKINEDIRDTLSLFKLEGKQNDLARTLSGGQKRKLSVAIAIIGDSKVIVLDEPTSGMDPGARRQLWDILQRFKDGRTIVLSTHFMDEADVLGDRIAIMADGVVKCCGSSMFLKKLYGTGYHLVMVKEPRCDVSKLLEIIQIHIPAASLDTEVGAELSFLLPTEGTSKFEGLFTELEEKGPKLGISSFGMSATTMEEVFLRVKEDKGSDNEAYDNGIRDHHHVQLHMTDGASFQENSDETNLDIDFNEGFVKNSGIAAVFQQYRGLLLKKALHTWRSRVMIFFQLAVPVLLAIFGLLADRSLTEISDHTDPPLQLDLHPFPNSITTVTPGPNPTTLAKNTTREFANWFIKNAYQVSEYEKTSDFDIDRFWLDRNKQIGQRTFNSKFVIGFGFEDNQIISYYNGEVIHSLGISLSYTMNFLLKLHCGQSKSINTINKPLPPSEELRSFSRSSGFATFKGLSLALCILFGLSCLVASFSVFHIREKSSGAKHLQKVSGVSSRVFWLANLTWDFIHYLIPIFLILICFAGFQIKAYTEDKRLGLVFLSLCLFGLASISWMYLLQFIFRSPAGGTVAMIIINTVAGLFTLLMVTFLYPIKQTKSTAEDMDSVFMVFLPHYCLGKMFTNIYARYAMRVQCQTQTSLTELLGTTTICPDNNYLEWDYPGCGKYLLMMSIQVIVYLGLVLLLDSGIIQRFLYPALFGNASGTVNSDPDHNTAPDLDVAEEARRVTSTQMNDLMNTDKLIIKNMKKTYGIIDRFDAVKDISVGISEQECFGLLGQNGAGKTTTFKMLTGDVMISSGNAYINGFSVQSQLRQVHKCLGYCPQFDALIETLTGREILTLYARLRGVSEREIRRVVNVLMDAVTLTEYADKLCGTYSGGNKRKLSTAIALVGDPPFLMLDEPTTGVDPAARRLVWNVLSKIRASGRTLVLTSHSMEECDALCTKIVIMVNGKFVCFGSPQHLKNRFAQGYTLIVKLARDNNGYAMDSGPLRNHLVTEFPGTQIFDDQQGYLEFRIPNPTLSLAKLFREMETTKTECNVEDYSVHQTSLEQVFLAFTRGQVPPTDKKRKCPCCFCCRAAPAYQGQIIGMPAGQVV